MVILIKHYPYQFKNSLSKIQRSTIIILDKEQDLMSNPGEQVLLQRVPSIKVHYYGLRSQWLINSTEREKRS